MGSLLKSERRRRKDAETQCAIFLHMTGEDAIEIYNTFIFTDEEKGKSTHSSENLRSTSLPRKMSHARGTNSTRVRKTADHSMSSLATYEVD